MPLNSSPVAGNPDAVATSNGTTGLVWRDTAGNLWTDLGSSSGWFGAHEVGTGGLASDPTVATSGLGTVDAIWRTTSGSVWAAAVTPNGGPGQVEVELGGEHGATRRRRNRRERGGGGDATSQRHPCSRDLQPRQRMDRAATAEPDRGDLAALGGELGGQRCRSLLAGERRQPVVVGRL